MLYAVISAGGVSNEGETMMDLGAWNINGKPLLPQMKLKF